MSFNDFFKDNKSSDFKKQAKQINQEIIIQESTIEDVRKAGIKVKSSTPLPGGFGVIYEFFTKNDARDANKILKGKLQGTTVAVQ